MAATDQDERAADLLERLLTDKAFRATFRQNPAAAARKFGLDELADYLPGAGKALYTLEIRESRSSLAGMMMAAALEGADVSNLADPALANTPGQVALTRALSRVDLEAVTGQAAGGGTSGDAPAELGIEPVDPDATGPSLSRPEREASGIFAGVVPDEPARPRGDTIEFTAVDGAQPDGDAAVDGAAPGEGGGAVGAAADLGSAAAGAGGGQATIEAVIADPDLDLPPEVVADLRSGEMDPRMVMLLHKLGNSGHEIGLSVMQTGHRQFTSGGSVSNHFVGRGFDVATVDGEPVSPSNVAARDVAEQLAELPPELRPTEIGTPWPIDEEGFFSDAAHCNHLHIGWDGVCPDSVRADFEAGTGIAAAGTTPAGAAAAAAGAADAAIPSGPLTPEGADLQAGEARQSGVFAGVVEPAAQQAGAGSPHSTVQFLQAIPGDPGSAPPVPADAAATGDPNPLAPEDASGAAAQVLPAVVDALPGEYPGDGAPKEEIARWMAAHAQAAGLPAELPIMAALVESGLSNVDHGDADSLGYFQMRTSIWNQGEYAGYADNPELQLKWFIDHAVAEREKWVARGVSDYGADPNKWGEWIADVERPAEQYRGRYQLRLDEARALLNG